jgi:hypothetical protein
VLREYDGTRAAARAQRRCDDQRGAGKGDAGPRRTRVPAARPGWFAVERGVH